MVGPFRKQTWLTMLAALSIASFAAAQGGNAMLEGIVKDQKGAPVPGATVTLKSAGDGGTRTYNAKTGKDGKFTLIGIYPTEYDITAALTSANLEAVPSKMRLPAGQMSKIELNMADKALLARTAAAATDAGKAEAAVRAKLGKAFEEGVAAANAGNHDVAIAKFKESLAISEKCAVCYKNIGFSHAQKKEWPQAEEAYKQAIAITPDADAYNGLANAYTQQKKYEQAAEANANAAKLSAAAGGGAAGGGGGDAESLYAQGVNLFNANKGPEAKAALQGAVKSNPNHADAHYLLGLVLIGEGDTKGALAAFQTYLKLAPNGKDAATAKAALDTLK
jgi:tetratricopeptide (TPR) repeat protein